MKKNKKILFISYRFAPEATAGSIRSIKFAKYLPSLNWDVTVLTNSNPPKSSIDKETLLELPHSIKIVTGPRIEPTEIRTFIEKILPKKLRSACWRIESFLNFILYPDFSAIWQFLVLPKAIWLCYRNKYDVIYSTYAPASNHFIAYIISKIFSIKWVSDYRDLWVHDFEYKPLTSFHRNLDKRLEKLFINNANAIITTSTGLTELMRNAYPNHAKKIITIPNGFDPADKPEPFHKKHDSIVFAHIGTLYSSRSVNHIIEALDSALDDPKLASTTVILKLIGNVHTKLNQPKRFKLLLTGWRNRKEALQELACSDVCVLILHNAEGGQHPVPQKLYEYIAFGKTTLATGHKNCFASDILKETTNNFYIDYKDKITLNRTIKTIIEKETYETIAKKESNKEFEHTFSRITLAKKLSNVINSVIQNEKIMIHDFRKKEVL